jgi:hydroxymethylpyrimidine/phosphomethylpyrimidine kinase
MAGDPIDLLRDAGGRQRWRHSRIDGVNTHGSGCMLSAAIAAGLATGRPLAPACESGLAFVHDALARGVDLAGGIRLADVEGARADRSALS